MKSSTQPSRADVPTRNTSTNTDSQPGLTARQSVAVDGCLSSCQMLAQPMQGELLITDSPMSSVRANSNALFDREEGPPSSRLTVGETQLLTNHQQVSMSTRHAPRAEAESFDRRYLDALFAEGVDLARFLESWCRAMEDDLASLGAVHRGESPQEHLPAVLHRLSGAAGLVGALSLMEAFSSASASPSAQSHSAIGLLIYRARNLVSQLAAPSLAHRIVES